MDGHLIPGYPVVSLNLRLRLLALQVLVAKVGGKTTDEDEGVQGSTHAGAACVGGSSNSRGESLGGRVTRLR